MTKSLYILLFCLSVLGLSATTDAMEGSVEPDRLLSLKDLWGKYHYTAIFSEQEQREIESALAILKSPKAEAMLAHNLSCFGKASCQKFLIGEILSSDKDVGLSEGNTDRNQKATHQRFPNWFFHLTVSLPPSSYPLANILRAPFSARLQKLVDAHGLESLKISRQGIFPLYDFATLLGTSPNMADVGIYSFIVVADFERMLSPQQMIVELREQKQTKKVVTDLETLVRLSGFVDLNGSNVALDSGDGRLVLFDTEPLAGEVLLIREEYEALSPPPLDAFDFYHTTRAQLAQRSSANKVIRLLMENSLKTPRKKMRFNTDSDDDDDSQDENGAEGLRALQFAMK